MLKAWVGDSDPDGDTPTVVHAGDKDVTAQGVDVAGTAGVPHHPPGRFVFLQSGRRLPSLAAGETKTTTVTYIDFRWRKEARPPRR